MKMYFPGMSTPLDFYTPEELLEVRKGQPEHVEDRTVLNAILDIRSHYSTVYFDYVLNICEGAFLDLKGYYDYQDGFEVPVFPDQIPSNVRKVSELTLKFLTVCVETLRCLGWNVTWLQGQDHYILKFGPKIVLTPAEVDAEIERRVMDRTILALQVAFSGMIVNRFKFTLRELGLENVAPTLYPLILARMREIMPDWVIDEVQAGTELAIKRATP